ncbi:MAG: phosphatase PAP2 family protein [Mycoplasmataceae bacterium]|nr:phosphatase PAP2 family protein [Mycoplasmataceae bacterium]
MKINLGKDRFNFFHRHHYHRANTPLLLFLFSLIMLTFALEAFAYFGVAIVFGKIVGINNTFDFKLPLDNKIPWFTPFIIYYVPWIFIWFLVLPIIIYFSNGKRAVLKYIIVSIVFYFISTLLYLTMPSTCKPHDYWYNYDCISSNGFIENDPFYPVFHWLMGTTSQSNGENIWGSFPSFHNFWAFILVAFGLMKGTKNRYRYPMIVFGLLLSLSTLMLHQHNIMDVIITYALGFLCWVIDIWLNWTNRLNKLFENKLNSHIPWNPKIINLLLWIGNVFYTAMVIVNILSSILTIKYIEFISMGVFFGSSVWFIIETIWLLNIENKVHIKRKWWNKNIKNKGDN